MEQKIFPAPWKSYADDADHYSYVRCLDLGNLYEVVRVTHDKHGQQAEFVHQIIFMAEYDEPAIAEILKGFGYENLDAFVRETNSAGTDPAGFTLRPDGSIDRAASPSWWIDYTLLASLMAEHFDGRIMTIQAADDLARTVVEMNPIAPNPFCIRRTFGGQLVTIPLTEAETNTICAIKDKQVCMARSFPANTSHSADDSAGAAGAAAAYAVTVIRQRNDGRHTELYFSAFQIAQDRLPEPSGAACETYLRKVVSDFLQTEDGKRAYKNTCYDFNWGDVETEIPDDFFSAYGVTHCGSRPDNGKFLCCGTIGILVYQDELLGECTSDDEEMEL